jgi:hypothetical protein
VTRMTASVLSLMIGSGTDSTETFRFPCQVTALIGPLSSEVADNRSLPAPGAANQREWAAR